jgi:ABC-type uncharacterized transport system substrate-binding protein
MFLNAVCIRGAAAGLLYALLAGSPALAHPHVWITARSEIAYDEAGHVRAVRHIWTFDEMFSAYAIQGLDENRDGELTREELTPLAETNIASLRKFGFFTFAELDGMAVAFASPTDYWLEHGTAGLTLHFTLPVEGQSAPTKSLKVEIYDLAYFVDFALLDEDAAILVGAPVSCEIEFDRSEQDEREAAVGLSEDAAKGPPRSLNIGGRYAKRILVRCDP